MAKEVLLTQEGYEELVKELDYLKTEKRRELAEKIKIARGFGDLSENSEYDEAKNEQGLVEQRIMELEAMMKMAKIVTRDNMDAGTVSVGTHVVVEDENGKELSYDIVGSTEFDPANGKISEDSPVGAALHGHKVGTVATVELPTGKIKRYKIKEIMVNE